MLHWAWLDLMRWAGKLANLAGVPGIVREGEYESGDRSIGIAVRRGEFHTVISVNGIEVYFNRLTGAIMSVSASRPSRAAVSLEASSGSSWTNSSSARDV
jgi:hypothetical protein